jgi:hypothetical protein
MVCKIRRRKSDGISEVQKWFVDSNRNIHDERTCLAMENFLFFFLYSVSCIATNSTTLENTFDSCLCLVLSIRISSSALRHSHQLIPTQPVRISRSREILTNVTLTKHQISEPNITD